MSKTAERYYEKQRKDWRTNAITSNEMPDYSLPFYQQIFDLMDGYSSSKDARIKELEARLETAENGLEKAINFIDNEADKAMRNGACRDVVDYYDNFKSELIAFLTNKTE
jgi:hypothetical protein